MSKVFRPLILLFSLFLTTAVLSSEPKDQEVWESAMEWAGHPVFREKKIVRNLVSDFYRNLKTETETSIRESIDAEVSSPKALRPEVSKRLSEDLKEIPDLGGISYDLPGFGKDTLLKEETDFPESFQSFSYKNGKISYFFRNRTDPNLEKWESLKLIGSFYAFTEAGALILCKEAENASPKFRDIRELRAYFQEKKKKSSSLELFHENGIYLFYFPGQNLFPYYLLFLSKIALLVLAPLLSFLYFKRFWEFLKDQRKRSYKAQAQFLRDRQKDSGSESTEIAP
ncbi:hypothetical protein [Leptospira fletcheri]|uniref:hypothetical protein n=1 Tax=Leptospira fletcheri TaxID=2484981 RepID=UPI001FE8D222|nr:hypothetical protein [Leptospira fletcheri]